MPHAINGRQIFEQMPGGWPKTSEQIIDWARTHDEFPLHDRIFPSKPGG